MTRKDNLLELVHLFRLMKILEFVDKFLSMFVDLNNSRLILERDCKFDSVQQSNAWSCYFKCLSKLKIINSDMRNIQSDKSLLKL